MDVGHSITFPAFCAWDLILWHGFDHLKIRNSNDSTVSDHCLRGLKPNQRSAALACTRNLSTSAFQESEDRLTQAGSSPIPWPFCILFNVLHIWEFVMFLIVSICFCCFVQCPTRSSYCSACETASAQNEMKCVRIRVMLATSCDRVPLSLTRSTLSALRHGSVEL